MRAPFRTLAFATLCATATLASCNNEQQTQALVQARMDAEKVKDLTTQNQELKAANDKLVKDNEGLRALVAKLQARETVATREAPKARGEAGTNAGRADVTPAEVDTTKKEATGGGSLK